MIPDIFYWIGLIVCLIGASTVILLGLMLVRNFIIGTYYEWKLSNLEENYKYEVTRLAVLHLMKLKQKYPELEITFNDEILGDD